MYRDYYTDFSDSDYDSDYEFYDHRHKHRKGRRSRYRGPCDDLTDIIKAVVGKDEREEERHDHYPERYFLGVPHWDNMPPLGTNRIKYDPKKGIEYNVASALDPDGSGLYVRYPGSRLVFFSVIPTNTPIPNIESLVLHVENLKNSTSSVQVRLEMVRRPNQGFANYVTLVTEINLGPKQKSSIDVTGLLWSPTRNLIDSTGANVPGFEAWSLNTLTDLNNVLTDEQLFDYPNSTGGARYDHTGLVDFSMPSSVYAFSIGPQDTNIVPSTDTRHTHFILTGIDVKTVGVEKISKKVAI